MDPWQALPVLSCFPTEEDIFSFPQENVSSRQKKKKVIVVFIVICCQFFLQAHCKLYRQGFIHHFQMTGMKVPCQQK